jgi:Fe-S-cluster-containing hydrogenase component 2
MHAFESGQYYTDEESGKKFPVLQQKATTCDLCREVDGQPSCVYACPHDAAHRMSGGELLKLVGLAPPEILR